MIRPKNIQISYELFLDMIAYISDHPDESDYRLDAISTAVNNKLEAMVRRDLYTVYKTGATSEIRAMAKEQYMDMMGIPSSYRWSNKKDVNVQSSGDKRRMSDI